MRQTAILQAFLLLSAVETAFAIDAPSGLVSRTGDQSIVLHWDRNSSADLAGYRVYRSTAGPGGPFTLLNASLLTAPGYCDISSSVVNGQTIADAINDPDNALAKLVDSPAVDMIASPHSYDNRGYGGYHSPQAMADTARRAGKRAASHQAASHAGPARAR